MRIKLDENLPAILASDLARLGHDLDTVPREGLKGHPDPELWEALRDLTGELPGLPPVSSGGAST